jgi:cell wall-associated NlpC family hydrolase
LAVTAVAALTSGLAIPRASADSISDLRAQAAALVSRINSLGLQEDALSEQYDAARNQVQTLDAQVSAAAQQLTATEARTSRDRAVLLQDAVDAYVNGGNSPQSTGSTAMQSANNALLRAEYADTLATDQNNAIDQYHLASLQQQAAEVNLKHKESAAKAEVQKVASAQHAVVELASQLSAQKSQITGQIATLVAQQEAAAAAAAQRAAQQRLAAQQAAAAQAAQAAAQAQPQVEGQAQTVGAAGGSGSGGAGGGAGYGPPPPVGSGASGAVAAAESRVGDPYVWGASGPNAFDCSGLVMWAYAQVGISLPHFSGAQYADTTHISMSQLEPGDLVFPADPSQHVAMYVGGGMIVQAPYTGADVQIIPLSSFFVLASRVA